MPALQLRSARHTRLTHPNSVLRLALLAALLCSSGLTLAQTAPVEDPDLDALKLADTMVKAPEAPRAWRFYAEAGAGAQQLRQSSGQTREQQEQRLSFDLQWDLSLHQQWRLLLADRLDLSWPANSKGEHAVNTLKEAYLSWKPQDSQLLDVGRINVRNGVAYGYNPVDFFKEGAVRSLVSIDPASLKENRQGSIMLRAQQLWDGGSATLIAAPRLADASPQSGWNPDVGATNHSDRYMLVLSQKVADFSPQFLIMQQRHQPAQFGATISGLVNDATVTYLEWAGGHSTPLLDQVAQNTALRPFAAQQSGQTAWHNQWAAGVSYTTQNKLTLTAELHINGRAVDQDGWDRLQRGPLPLYAAYRNAAQLAQQSPTRQQLFLYASWQDALISHLDLSAMLNRDQQDASKRLWLEARYHQGKLDVALQWQKNSGSALSQYGAINTESGWRVLLRQYF